MIMPNTQVYQFMTNEVKLKMLKSLKFVVDGIEELKLIAYERTLNNP